MEKNKNLIFLVFLLAILVMTFANAAGVANLVMPVSNYTNASGTLTVNCSATINTTVLSYNISIYYNLSGGEAGKTATKLTTIWNSSETTQSFQETVSITSISSSSNVNISCYADNSTDQVYSAAVKGNTFDSVSPTCSVIAEKKTFPYKGTMKLTWSITDDLSLVSNSAALDEPQSQTNLTLGAAVNETTLNSIQTSYIGDWLATTAGTDRSGNTCAASTTFKSYMPDGVGEIGKVAGAVDYSKITIVVIVVIALYFLFGRKK